MEKWKLSGYLEVEGVQGTINTFLIFWWGEPARLPQTGQKKIILTTMGSVMEVGVGISSSLMGTERRTDTLEQVYSLTKGTHTNHHKPGLFVSHHQCIGLA